MKLPRTILVAVDFSTGSHAAMEQAVRLALSCGASLHVVHVVDSAAVATMAEMQGGGYESHAASAAQGARDALDRWMQQWGPQTAYDGIIAMGHPVHEILEHVRALNAGLLVAGPQGAGRGTTHAGAGSVAARLARHSPVPVLLVRPAHEQAFQKIVACLDFSPASTDVMQAACLVAREHAGRVECLHVWKEPWVVDFDPESTVTSNYPVIVFTRQEKEAHIQDLLEQLRAHVAAASPDVPCTEVLQEAGSHGAGIVDHARESQADLVVIGRTGHGRLRELLLGSTAERLLNHTPCSVLVVHSSPKGAPEPSPSLPK